MGNRISMDWQKVHHAAAKARQLPFVVANWLPTEMTYKAIIPQAS
jgi:hypothetical protein